MYRCIVVTPSGFLWFYLCFLYVFEACFRSVQAPSCSFGLLQLLLASFSFLRVLAGSFGFLRVPSGSFGPPSAEGGSSVKFLQVSKPEGGLKEAEGGRKMRPGTPKVGFPCTIETGGPWLAPLARGTWGPP